MIGPIANIDNGESYRGFGQSNEPLKCPNSNPNTTTWQEWIHFDDKWQWKYNLYVTIDCNGIYIL